MKLTVNWDKENDSEGPNWNIKISSNKTLIPPHVAGIVALTTVRVKTGARAHVGRNPWHTV